MTPTTQGDRERVSFRFPPGLMKRIQQACKKEPMKYPTATQFVVWACDSLLIEIVNKPKKGEKP